VAAAEVEYRLPITPADDVRVGATDDALWLVGADDIVRASATVRFRPAQA
jgi:hypothetical protein